MKEVTYHFHNLGGYVPTEAVSFNTESHLRLIIEPHSFELKISGEVIRSSSCEGYTIEVSQRGEVRFLDRDNQLLATASEGEKEFSQVVFQWKQDQLLLKFGRVMQVDNYPNCDGEYDRWSEEWVSEYEVRFSARTNQIETTDC